MYETDSISLFIDLLEEEWIEEEHFVGIKPIGDEHHKTRSYERHDRLIRSLNEDFEKLDRGGDMAHLELTLGLISIFIKAKEGSKLFEFRKKVFKWEDEEPEKFRQLMFFFDIDERAVGPHVSQQYRIIQGCICFDGKYHPQQILYHQYLSKKFGTSYLLIKQSKSNNAYTLVSQLTKENRTHMYYIDCKKWEDEDIERWNTTSRMLANHEHNTFHMQKFRENNSILNIITCQAISGELGSEAFTRQHGSTQQKGRGIGRKRVVQQLVSIFTKTDIRSVEKAEIHFHDFLKSFPMLFEFWERPDNFSQSLFQSDEIDMKFEIRMKELIRGAFDHMNFTQVNPENNTWTNTLKLNFAYLQSEDDEIIGYHGDEWGKNFIVNQDEAALIDFEDSVQMHVSFSNDGGIIPHRIKHGTGILGLRNHPEYEVLKSSGTKKINVEEESHMQCLMMFDLSRSLARFYTALVQYYCRLHFSDDHHAVDAKSFFEEMNTILWDEILLNQELKIDTELFILECVNWSLYFLRKKDDDGNTKFPLCSTFLEHIFGVVRRFREDGNSSNKRRFTLNLQPGLKKYYEDNNRNVEKLLLGGSSPDSVKHEVKSLLNLKQYTM